MYALLNLQTTPAGSTTTPSTSSSNGLVQLGDCSKTHVVFAQLSFGADNATFDAAAYAAVNVVVKTFTVSAPPGMP